jgi:hypothetical protein
MTYAATILADTPQVYYRLNDSSGSVAVDSSGNGHNGTLSGVATYGQIGVIVGDSNTCMQFSAGGGVAMPNTLLASMYSAATLEYWINASSGWIYIAIAVDSGSTTLYLNGTPYISSSGIDRHLIDVGLHYAGVNAIAYLDEVALYNYKLSAAKVASHYTASGYIVALGTYVVKIAGSTVAIKGGTLSIDLGLGKRGAASFLVQQPDTSTHYQQYQQVSIFDLNNTLIFTGYIDTPQEMQPGHANYLTNQMTCMDQRWLTDKRLVFSSSLAPDVTLAPSTILAPGSSTLARTYTNRGYDVIVYDLYNSILREEGVTIGAILTGPYPSPTLAPSTTLAPNGPNKFISSVTFNYPTVTQALDALVKAASDSSGVTFYWSIDQNKQLWFVPYSYTVNNTVVDGTQIDQVRHAPYVTRANPLYRNVQYVMGGTPTGASSARNGSQVTAQKALDGTSGIVESVAKDTAITNRADDVIEANQLLNVYCVPGALRFVFPTRVSGYMPGQQITVTYGPFGFSSTKMLVESVHVEDPQDLYDFLYTITAIIGPYDANWANFFGKLLSPSGVSSASSISIGI